MLSKEEISKLKINVFNQCDDETIRLVAEMLKHTDQLESDKQKLIEKLEKRMKLNNEKYGQVIDEDEPLEMYEYSAKVEEDKYILKILKGEKKWDFYI